MHHQSNVGGGNRLYIGADIPSYRVTTKITFPQTLSILFITNGNCHCALNVFSHCQPLLFHFSTINLGSLYTPLSKSHSGQYM